MQRIMSLNRAWVTKSQFGRLSNWFGVLMIAIVVGALVGPLLCSRRFHWDGEP